MLIDLTRHETELLLRGLLSHNSLCRQSGNFTEMNAIIPVREKIANTLAMDGVLPAPRPIIVLSSSQAMNISRKELDK